MDGLIKFNFCLKLDQLVVLFFQEQTLLHLAFVKEIR